MKMGYDHANATLDELCEAVPENIRDMEMYEPTDHDTCLRDVHAILYTKDTDNG